MSANMMFTALSGLNTFSDALSVVADNVANANTTAFKNNTVDFGDMVSGYMATSDINITAQGVGTDILGVTTDFGTGNEISTGKWSNLMIQGNGLFAVQDSSGADYYTRDGSFQIDTAGYLTDMNDNKVLDASAKPIQIEDPTSTPYPKYSSYAIDKFGDVTGTDSTGTVTTIGQIGITTFANPDGLIRNGQNMYVAGASAGTAIEGTAGSGQAGLLTSGALEGSNVDLTGQLINMIAYQADYQANSKSIITGSENLQTVVNIIK